MAAPAYASSAHTDYVGGSAATSIALAKPSGIVADSPCVVTILFEGATGSAPTGITPPASGGTWTLVQYDGTKTDQGDGTTVRLAVYEYRAGASETSTSPASTWTFTWTNGTHVAGATYRLTGTIASGSFFDTPIDNEAAGSAGTSTPAVQLTTPGGDRLLLWFATAYLGNTAWTPPATFTEVVQGANITGAWKEQTAAGDTGALTGSNADSDRKGAFLGSVKADAGTPETGPPMGTLRKVPPGPIIWR